MTVINFPSTPSLNQVYEVNGVTYIWDGTKWATRTDSFDPIRVNLSGDTITGNTDVTTINNLTWPTVDGSAGQTITTDGSGSLGYSDSKGWTFLTGGPLPTTGNAVAFSPLPQSATCFSLRLYNVGHQGASATVNEIMGVSLNDLNLNSSVVSVVGHAYLQLGATPYHWDSTTSSGLALPLFGGGYTGDVEVEILKISEDTWVASASGMSDASFGPFIASSIMKVNVGVTPIDAVIFGAPTQNFRAGGEAYLWYK